MPQNRIDLPLQTREAAFGSVDEKERTAELIWSTGARVKRYDWERGRYYWEELGMRADEVRLARLNNGAPLLDSHNRWSLEGVLGVVGAGTAKVDGSRGTATVRFSKREEVEPVFRDVKDKIIVNVSAGYVIHRMQETAEMVDGIPVYRAIDWEPMELSLVPIGADAGASVRNEGQQRTYPCEIITTRKEVDMPNTALTDSEQESAKPSAAEQKRTRTIRELCTHAQMPETETMRFLTEGASVAEVRTAILSRQAEVTNSTNIRSGFVDMQNGDLEPQIRRGLIVEALCERFGGPTASERAREFLNLRIPDIARMCLEERGVSTRGMSVPQIITRVSHSSSDFSELLAGVGNRTLRASYLAHQSGIMKVFKKTTAPDFRAKQLLAMSEAPTLLEVKAGGEIKHGTMAETKESYTLATYARIMGINRQALVNDDLNAFGEMTAKWGQSAAELVANTLATLVNSNPTLNQDNAAVFSATHLNLTTGASPAITVDTLGTGVSKMRLQKGISNNVVLGLGPRYLLVPAAQEQVAKQYTSPTYQPTAPSGINPWNVQLEPIVEPRLDALTTGDWYLFADPAVLHCFEYAYLEGEEGPFIDTRMGWEIEGVEFKCRLDLGAGAVEYRGAYKRQGS